MSDEPEPAPQLVGAAQDDRDAVARRRLTSAYIISQAGLIEAGVDARSDDSGDEFSSTSGDTFSDMILKLLKQMTMGDGIININVYNLLHQAGLDEFLVNSLTSALKLEGEDNLSAENVALLETMSTSALDAVATICVPVTVALKDCLENATNYSRTQISDLILAGSAKQGNNSRQALDRLREEEDDKQFRAVYISVSCTAVRD